MSCPGKSVAINIYETDNSKKQQTCQPDFQKYFFPILNWLLKYFCYKKSCEHNSQPWYGWIANNKSNSPDKRKAPGVKNGIRNCFTNEVSVRGISGDKLCKNIIDKPMIPIVFEEHFKSNPRMIRPKPIVDNTSKRNTLK